MGEAANNVRPRSPNWLLRLRLRIPLLRVLRLRRLWRLWPRLRLPLRLWLLWWLRLCIWSLWLRLRIPILLCWVCRIWWIWQLWSLRLRIPLCWVCRIWLPIWLWLRLLLDVTNGHTGYSTIAAIKCIFDLDLGVSLRNKLRNAEDTYRL